MKRTLCTMICALTFLGLICSLAVPALADPASTDAPEWTEGDRWAYGVEEDFGSDIISALQSLSTYIENETDATINELDFDGDASSWLLFEVTDVTDDEYVLSMEMAGHMAMDASISLTVEVPDEGIYDYGDDPTMSERTISMDANMNFNIIVNVEVTFEKDTMAIESVSLDMKLSASLDFEAENIPSVDDQTEFDWYNYTTVGTIEYNYVDYDISADLNAELSMDLDFEPALNIWDFPLTVDDQWTATSNATLEGTFSGSLDVNGLPDEYEEQIFSEGFFNETGISEFPIIFENIGYDEDDEQFENFPFNNGVIDPITGGISIDLRCTDVDSVDDDYWGEITVYTITVDDSPLEFYYSPDVGFMSYFSMDTTDFIDTEEISDMGIPWAEEMTMEAVDPNVAESNINEISDEIDGSNDGIMGFFTEAPYLGIILVAVILVVIVAAIVVIRKK